MNKLISSLVKTAVVYAAALTVTNLNAQTSSSSPKVDSVETFTVTSVPAESGSYTISPKIPDDGKVPAGTILSVKVHHGSKERSPGYLPSLLTNCHEKQPTNY
jgi:hypothetical protein